VEALRCWSAMAIAEPARLLLVAFSTAASICAGLTDLGMKARFIELGGYKAIASSPTDFGKLIAEYTEKWGNVIRAAHIKLD